MSSRVFFQVTKFTDLSIVDGKLVESEDVDYGYRLFDDYGKTYDNMLTEKEALALTPEKALKIINENEEFAVAVVSGFLFNGEWLSKEDNPEVWESLEDDDDEDEEPCYRAKDQDGCWYCVNDHTGCLWNDGQNGCTFDPQDPTCCPCEAVPTDEKDPEDE
jgi:hypothetical protein